MEKKADLRISLIQSGLFWENPTANLNHFEHLLKPLKNETNLVVLPEMFTTGFSMSPQGLAEEWPGKTVNWMQEQVLKGSFALCGSIMTTDGHAYYNRFVWVGTSGEVKFFDKRHLFRMGGENEVYSSGNQKLIIEYNGWRIAPFICYDLRFPVWSRNRNEYDLAIYVANWPAPRYLVWEKLLMARALENQCYVAGVNRIGTDGRNLKYSGNTMIINPRGEVDQNSVPGTEEVVQGVLSLETLEAFRKKFPVMLDADDFEIQL